MEPPHPGRPSYKRTTCHGQEFGDAFDPPMTRLFDNGFFPHWVFPERCVFKFFTIYPK